MTSHFSFISLNFFLNQDVIAEQHCVNRDSPELNCSGKCYLSKALDDAQQQSKRLDLQRDFLQLMQTLPALQAFHQGPDGLQWSIAFAPLKLPCYTDPLLKRSIPPPRS